jgi:hypothetical protein
MDKINPIPHWDAVYYLGLGAVIALSLTTFSYDRDVIYGRTQRANNIPVLLFSRQQRWDPQNWLFFFFLPKTRREEKISI